MDIAQLAKKGRLAVIVRPNSRTAEITGWDDERNALKVSIKAAPEKGKANIELIKLLRKTMKKDIHIVSGMASHRKVLKLG